jgi:maltooligosyltrehalose trehalohydrolase
MGEEYGEENPFPFFCAFQAPELIEAVRVGRKQQFADPDDRAQVPDPASEETFGAARLSWSWPEGTFRSGLRRLYRDLLAARREWPALRDFENRTACITAAAEGGFVLELVRGAGESGQIRILFNLGERPVALPEPCGAGERVIFSSESSAYLGARQGGECVDALLPWECVVFK